MLGLSCTREPKEVTRDTGTVAWEEGRIYILIGVTCYYGYAFYFHDDY